MDFMPTEMVWSSVFLIFELLIGPKNEFCFSYSLSAYSSLEPHIMFSSIAILANTWFIILELLESDIFWVLWHLVAADALRSGRRFYNSDNVFPPFSTLTLWASLSNLSGSFCISNYFEVMSSNWFDCNWI